MVLLGTTLRAQTPADAGEPMRIGPGVIRPRLIHKVEPHYTGAAQDNRVQGTVILQIVINEKGRVTDISVISPFGFGLDEEAQAAVEQWEFTPGTKAGVPVKILATVEVNFRIPGRNFDEKWERQRTKFNTARQTLNDANASATAFESAVRTMMDLGAQRFAPAMYVVGVWKLNGEHVPKDVTAGLDWIQKAAAKNYGPALYDLAVRRIDGRDLPPDIEKGLQEMRAAARLGSRQAQFNLGSRYETGSGVPRELDRARQYYRLCAAQGVALCQYRLGRLLFDAQERRERDYLEAIALFQLAGEQGLADATRVVSDEVPKLTTEQGTWVATLKRQIVRK